MPNGIENSPVGQNRYDFLDDKSPEIVGGKDQGIVQPVKYDFLDKSSPEMVGQVSPPAKTNGNTTPIQGVNDYVMGNLDPGQINTAKNFKKNAVNDTVVNKTGIEGVQPVNKYTPLEALSDIGKVIADTPEMAAASIVRAYEGDKPSFEGTGISGAIKENARKLTERRRAEASKRASKGETLLGVSPQDVESARQSTGFSGVSAVSALVSGIGTTALTKNPIAGYAAGATTSGVLAQRMQANSFLTNAIGSISDAVEEQTGVKLTPKQKREASKLIRDEANASGWWEAIPEAIGNVAGFRIIRGPVGAVAEKIATKVLGKKAGKSIAGRAIGKLAKLYGVEVATETVTQVGQKNVDVATGIDTGAKRSFTSPSDVYKSLKEVLPSTLILTTLMGGGVGAGSVAYNKLNESGTGITNANADVTDSTGMYKDEQKIADSLQNVIDDPKATTAQKDDAYNGIGVLKNQVAKRAAKNDQQTDGNSTVEDLDAEFKMYEDKSMQDSNINPEEVNALKNSLKIMNDPNTTTEQKDQAGSYIDSLKSIIKQRNIQQEQDITAEADRINTLDAQQQQGLATSNDELSKKVSEAKKSIDDAKNEISQPLPVKDVPVTEGASKQSRAKAQPEIKQKLTVQLRKEIEKAGNVLNDPSSTEVERDNARNAIDIAKNAVSDNAVTSASVQPVTGENVSQYRSLAEDSIKTINNPESSKDEKTQATEKLALVQSAISKEDNKNSRLINSDIASLYGKELKKANNIITGKKSTEVQKDSARKRVDEIQRQISKLPVQVAGKTKKEGAKEEKNVAASNRKNVVYDANNKPHNVTYEVVEADTMDASVKKDESQYRNREDAALKAQVNEISKNLIFDLVGPSPTMGLGAPVEADNGKITAGNGRLLAIIDAYRNGRAGEYKKKLLDTVESLGIDPAVVAGMKNPILRRKLDPGADVSALAKLSNEEGPASMPAVDQAKVDAERVVDVSSILKTKKLGGLTIESKVEIAKRIIASTPTARRGSFMDKNGRLSQEGERRVNNAILQSAYGDTSILSRLTESVNNDLKNIGTALLNASPKVAKMRKGIGDGKLYPADFIEDLVQAVEVVNEIRNKGQDINEFLSQQDSFNKIDPSTEALIRFMDKNVGNKEVITDLLINYTKMLETYGDPNQRGIFEQDAPTTMEVLNRAISKTETTKQKGKKQQAGPQKGNEPGAKESKKKEANVDLLGDNTQTAQKIADAQRSADEKLSPSGEQPALAQKGDELFANNGKLEKDLFDGINPPKKDNNIDSSGVWTGEIAGEKSSIDVNPSEDQINADNYLKAPILLNGLKITVENPAGTKRKAEWPKLKDHYGDIKRTEGADGEGVDVFIRNGSTKAELETGDVYVIDQMNKDGSFDEHKVVLGAKSSLNAKSIYKRNYSKGWKGAGKVTKFTWDEFKGWVKSAVNTTKPASLEPPALSRSSIKSTGSTVADVEGWLKKPIDKLAKWVKVEIVQDVSSLPIDNAPSDTRGVLHNGTVYIVADNVTKSDVQTVLAHEAVGHLGLERLLGNDSFNQLVKQVQSMKKTGNKRVARIVDNLKKNYVDENGNYSLDEKQESREILAHLAEKHKGLMVVRRIKIAIKKWLARNGFLNIDDVYIDSLIVRAAQITQNNYSGFVDKNGQLVPAYSNNTAAYSRKDQDKPVSDLESAKGKVGKKSNWGDKIVALRESPKSMAKGWWESIEQGVFDRFSGINNALKKAGVDVPAAFNGYIAARLSTSVSDRLSVLLKHGQMEWKDGVLQPIEGTKGFLEILDPVADKLEDFGLYLVGKRANEIQNPISGESRKSGFTENEIEAMLKLGKDNPEFDDVAREYAAINKSVLDIAEGAGLIDKESRQVWESDNYIPFYRILEQGTVAPKLSGKGIAGKSSGIQRLKGSDKNIGDPLENIMMNWAHLLDASVKNHAAVQVVDNLEGSGLIEKAKYQFKKRLVGAEEARKNTEKMLEQAGMYEDIVDLISSAPTLKGLTRLFSIDQPSGKDVIRVMRNGKPEFYHVYDQLLFRSMTAINQQAWSGMMEIFRMPKRLLTSMVTADPAFMGRNYLRDMVSAWVLGRDNFKPGIDSVKGAAVAFRQDPQFVKMMAAGGTFSSGGYVNANDPNEMKRFIKAEVHQKTFSKSLLNSPKRLWDFWQKLGASVENANRVAVSAAALKKGKGVAGAAYEMKDVMDFAMRGDYAVIQFLSESVPFFSARIQGLHRMGRGSIENPIAFSAKGSAIMVASIALYMLNRDDERFKKLQEWDRDTYYHFWIGEQHFRLPKPFEVGVLFGTMPERMVESIIEEDRNAEDFFKRMGWNLRQTLSLEPIPQVAKPIIEQWANKSFFTQRPIVGQRLINQAAETQYEPWTSETMRVVGKSWGVSPKRAEALVRGYFGTIGLYALSATDTVIRSLGDYPPDPTKSAENYPVLGSFYRGDGEPRNTRYTTAFYKMAIEVNKLQYSINEYRRQGESRLAGELYNENRSLLEGRKGINKIRGRLSKINKQIRAIYYSRNVGPDKKAEMIDRLIAEKNRITENGAKLYRK